MRTILTLLAACRPAPEPEPPEPLDLPADPAATGVPVGVRTEETEEGLSFEVWYPASDDAAGQPGEIVDFGRWIPAPVTDVLGPLELPEIPTIAVRDAPARRLAEPVPVVIFSHGFGGTRAQSVDLTSHLASRGYVVLATDHAGRSMPDLLPCLFSPPLEGCALAADDPAVADVLALAAWAEGSLGDSFLDGLADPDRLGLYGHSAGGGTTATVGNLDDRFAALLPMAGGGPVEVDTPTLRIAGTCDGIVPADGQAAAAGGPDETYAELVDAGHLAFSDLCTLDLGGLAERYLVDRPDVSPTFLAQLVALGTDGCPGSAPVPGLRDCGPEPLDPARAGAVLRGAETLFFDAALKGQGDGALDGRWPELVVR